MNDLSIQGSRAYATAYAANEVKTPPAAPATTAASSQSSSDTVSISAKAQELFQQSSLTTNSASPSESVAPPSTADHSSDVSIPNVTSPGPVTPMNGGGGVRPPEKP